MLEQHITAPPRWVLRRNRRLTPVWAVRLIGAVTLAVALVSGVAMRIVDGREFPTVWRGLWWAAQTVTTVGYGDVVPHATAGRVLAIVVMLNAVAFLTVVTGAVTAVLIEHARGVPTSCSCASSAQLEEIAAAVARLEAALHERSTTSNH